MLNRYSFETLDGGERSVSPKRTQEFDVPLPMEELLSRCANLAHLVARKNPDLSPWHGWTVELGILLPHHAEWSIHRIGFENLLANAGVEGS